MIRMMNEIEGALEAVLFISSIASDVGPLSLSFTGVYTLLVEGRSYTTGSVDYSFNVQKIADETAPIALDTTVSGEISHAGQRDFHTAKRPGPTLCGLNHRQRPC